MWRKIAVLALVLVAALLTEGCGGYVIGKLTEHVRRVPVTSPLVGGYAVGEVYKTKMPLFIGETDLWWKGYYLTPPREVPLKAGYHNAPDSMEIYKEDPIGWAAKEGIRGVVSEGTKLQIVEIMVHGAAIWGSSVFPFAEVLDGPCAGMKAEISDLSELGPDYEGIYAKYPDARFLELVQKPTEE